MALGISFKIEQVCLFLAVAECALGGRRVVGPAISACLPRLKACESLARPQPIRPLPIQASNKAKPNANNSPILISALYRMSFEIYIFCFSGKIHADHISIRLK